MIRRFWAAAGLAFVLAAGGAEAAPDVAKMTGGQLTAFARAMPKGGELHNHISGAIFAETLLAWAVEDGLCVNVKTLSVTPPCQPGEDLKPAAGIKTDEVLRAAMIDSFSVRHADFLDRSGHDQFFSAFGRFGAAGAKRDGDMLANVVDSLARQNTFYLEAMVTPQGVASRVKGAQVGWKGGDLAAQKAANTAAGLDALVAAAIAETDAMEARARALMKCGTPEALPGCQVTVRYLVQTSRVTPPEQTFAQLQMGSP
uniref:Adenosine deaminase n=1 Tax=Phenylobacterium glaciei TaxID=2803784 RepID=A0A974P1S4_9CAUL|nr:hypothetical protein JKL49_18205 [Phenylobacterium glaciei]